MSDSGETSAVEYIDSDDEIMLDEQSDSMSDADAASIASDEFDDSMNVGNLSSASAAAAASYKGKGKLRTSAHDVEFKVLGPQDIKKAQLNAIDYVSDLTSLKKPDAATLLRHFEWNKDRLIEAFMDSPEKTNAAAGIHESGSQPRLKRSRGFECAICCGTADETLALSCNHRFCKECYTNFVETKLGDGEARRIGCMQNDCSVVLDEKTVEILLDDEKRAKYSSLLDRTYVDDNPWLRWCPAPDCQNAVECQVPDRMLESVIPTVICACGNVFCFGCSREDHRPANCLVVKKWAKKCADDSETANWISTNTKECPKCHSTIEKNGGCNHMTCKKCRHEFCWVCMGPWSEHGQAYYNCNRFNDSDKPDHSKQRLSLERYLHYYNRFANHEQSIRLEQELYARIERKMDELQQNSSLSWIEAQFLAKAVETLSVCRTTLKWTYAMAFYLAKNNTTAMFLDNQSDLEQAVETLSELLEKPIEPETIPELRQQTTDKTVYVQKRQQVLLDDTMQGYEEDRWQWVETLRV